MDNSGEGGWTIGGRGNGQYGGGGMDNRGEGGHNRGAVNKVVVDNSKMVMCAGGCPLPQRPST